jgi:hypothetical protein
VLRTYSPRVTAVRRAEDRDFSDIWLFHTWGATGYGQSLKDVRRPSVAMYAPYLRGLSVSQTGSRMPRDHAGEGEERR